jgi:hypothetical protein
MGKYLTDEELAEMVRPVLEFVPLGSQWQHAKSSGKYTLAKVIGAPMYGLDLTAQQNYRVQDYVAIFKIATT